ncbi:MAG: acetate--CoA ligase family protein [Candidatus Parcubacteria bacterium]|nr:acetate--CoA ligase family protein [Candidatus Parcubacteria bacterium]
MNFDAVFNPKSIAVIGASRRETHVGYGVLKNLIEQGYQGEIFPVNPKADIILGRVCYPTVSAIGKPIDLGVFVVHPLDVMISLKEAKKQGVKAAIVITAGYKETGDVQSENELASFCNEHGITLVGPNCLGVINPGIRMNASFARLMPKAGSVGFFSQSGALCVAVLDYAEKLGIGFSKFVSIGNKAQVSEREMIEFLLNDSETAVIAMYLEDLTHPHEIIEIIQKARREGKRKPIIALKAGRTNAGAGASASHTGALAGAEESYKAFFLQAGIIRADKVSELFDYVKAFSRNPIPKGKRIGIVTNAGGPGVLATDEAALRGLIVGEFSKETRRALAEFLPKTAGVGNPVDVVGDADAARYQKSLDTVMSDPDIDMALAILTHQTMTEVEETAQAIVQAKKQTGKPIIACFMGGSSVEKGIEVLRDGGVATVEYPEESANALSKLALYSDYFNREEPKRFFFENIDRDAVFMILKKAREKGRKWLFEYEALQVFSAYGFPVFATEFARDREDAILKAKKIGKTLVMKIASEDILHKSEAGGVRINVSPDDAGKEYDRIIYDVLEKFPNAKIEGVLMEEMAERRGFEIILGAKRDPALGETVMVGFGGIYVEVLQDVAFGLAPITEDDAWRMVRSLKAQKIFDGVRGQDPLDVDTLVEMLGRLSFLVIDFPEIAEVDINPLKVFSQGNGACVLDARIILT